MDGDLPGGTRVFGEGVSLERSLKDLKKKKKMYICVYTYVLELKMVGTSVISCEIKRKTVSLLSYIRVRDLLVKL